jgi:alpha-L-arabinofuranosidase
VQPVAFDLQGASPVSGPARALILTSTDPADENSLAEPAKVVPVARELQPAGTMLAYDAPGNSVTVLRLKTGPAR